MKIEKDGDNIKLTFTVNDNSNKEYIIEIDKTDDKNELTMKCLGFEDSIETDYLDLFNYSYREKLYYFIKKVYFALLR